MLRAKHGAALPEQTVKEAVAMEQGGAHFLCLSASPRCSRCTPLRGTIAWRVPLYHDLLPSAVLINRACVLGDLAFSSLSGILVTFSVGRLIQAVALFYPWYIHCWRKSALQNKFPVCSERHLRRRYLFACISLMRY